MGDEKDPYDKGGDEKDGGKPVEDKGGEKK